LEREKATREDILETIGWLEKMRTDAIVVLDSGFGNKPGEHNDIYKRRKRLAEIALASLYKNLRELDRK